MKEHLNDYEKRIWEGIDKDAEEIIKMVVYITLDIF